MLIKIKKALDSKIFHMLTDACEYSTFIATILKANIKNKCTITHQVIFIHFFFPKMQLWFILNLTELILFDILSSPQPINENTLTSRNIHNCCSFIPFLSFSTLLFFLCMDIMGLLFDIIHNSCKKNKASSSSCLSLEFDLNALV